MRIGELDMHCGNCKIIDYCDEPYSEICVCCDKRFEHVNEESFLKLAETSEKKQKKAIIDDVAKKLTELGDDN